MNNCAPCYDSCPGNACSMKIKTVPCDPNSKETWFKHPVKFDPVRNNILNGCWMCNYEPQQTENNNICQRQFYDGYITYPFNKL